MGELLVVSDEEREAVQRELADNRRCECEACDLLHRYERTLQLMQALGSLESVVVLPESVLVLRTQRDAITSDGVRVATEMLAHAFPGQSVIVLSPGMDLTAFPPDAAVDTIQEWLERVNEREDGQ